MSIAGDSLLSEHRPLLSVLRPSSRYKVGRLLILASQFLERMGYYGLIANFIYFLNADPYAWTSYNAVSVVFIFNCASYLLAFFGAWLAETRLGKYKVIVIGYLLYLIFFIPIPFLYFQTWNISGKQNSTAIFCAQRNHSENSNRSFTDESCVGWIVICMTMVGVGAAFIKAVITPFGADQFPLTDTSSMRSFFNWYYWFINAGTFLAYTFIAFIQVNISMFWGYMIPYFFLFVSFFLFLLCYKYTRNSRPSGKGLDPVWMVLHSACRRILGNCRRKRRLVTPQTPLRSDASREEEVVAEDISCLDRCNERYGGDCPAKAVIMTKRLLKIMLLFTAFIFYWACYYQIESTFLSQGLHMKVLILMNSPEEGPLKTAILRIPVTWLTIFDILTILFLIPFLDSVINPFLDRHNLLPPLYVRMAFGMLFTMTAMIVAGFVEKERMSAFWGNTSSPFKPEHCINQTIGKTVYFAADMSVFTQIPQYALLGLGEAFTNVAGLEFAYTHAPRDLQALVTGLYWLFSGLGSLLGLGIVQIAHASHLLFSNDYFDINYRVPCRYANNTIQVPAKTCGETRLDDYFFILAGVQLFGLLLLVLVAWVMGLQAIGGTREACSLQRPGEVAAVGEEEAAVAIVATPGATIVNSIVRDSAPPEREVPRERRGGLEEEATRFRMSLP